MKILFVILVISLSACTPEPNLPLKASQPTCSEKLAAANTTMCATDWVIWGVDCKQAGNLQKECDERLVKARTARGEAALNLVEIEDSCPTLDTRHRKCEL